jgi:tetratricopeptide (TPR) repeat protein
MDHKISDFVKNNATDIILAFLIFLFAFVFTFNKIYEGDAFWHLKLGQYILNTHSLPFQDIFSYTFAGMRIYPVEWLFEVIWYSVYSFLGVAGIIVIKAVVAGFTSVFLYLSFEHYKINRYIGFAIIACAFIIAGSYFVDRPQIITYLGIALFVFITSLPHIDKKKILWSIPIIMLVWVNMHPGAVFGIIFLSAWLMEGFINLLKHDIKSDDFYIRLTIFFVTLLTTVITPNTYHLYTFLFHHVVSLGQKGGLEYIAEFMPPSLSQTPTMFTGLVIFTVIFLIGLFKMPLRYVFFGLVMLPLSFDMRRMVIMALIGIAPGIGIVVHDWLERLNKLNIPAVFMAVVYAVILVLPFGYEYYQYKTDYVGYKGIGIQKQFYPKQAIDFILRNHIKGNIYNSINFGGAVIFLGYPQVKDFIDTRLDPEMFLLPEVDQSMGSPSAFDRLLNKYKVSYALVETYLPVNYPRLLPAPEWHLVYFDDYAQIYVKQGTGNDDLVKQYAYTVFNPYTFLYTFVPFLSPNTYFTQQGLFSDLHKLVKAVPYSAMANLAYGLELIYNNSDYTDGLRYIDTAKRIMPYNPRIVLWYGIEHGFNGNARLMQKSFDMVNTVLKYQEGATDKDRAYTNFIMGYYYYVAGLNKQAIATLKKSIKLNPGSTEAKKLLDSIE